MTLTIRTRIAIEKAIQSIVHQNKYTVRSNDTEIEQKISLSTPGATTMTSHSYDSQCTLLHAQSTVVVSDGLYGRNKDKNCYELLQSGEINQYQCDMDSDGMPDICDDDIDGDGVINQLGILLDENNDCSITPSIINR
jgi:hypothetical protein